MCSYGEAIWFRYVCGKSLLYDKNFVRRETVPPPRTKLDSEWWEMFKRTNVRVKSKSLCVGYAAGSFVSLRLLYAVGRSIMGYTMAFSPTGSLDLDRQPRTTLKPKTQTGQKVSAGLVGICKCSHKTKCPPPSLFPVLLLSHSRSPKSLFCDCKSPTHSTFRGCYYHRSSQSSC